MHEIALYLVANVGLFTKLGVELTDFILMIAVGGALLGVFMGIGGMMTYVERKIAGFTQSRIGPNRVGPWGLLQFLADGVKLILKEDIIPAGADRPLFKLAPYAVVGGAFMIMAVLPLGPNLVPVDNDFGLLVYLAASSFVTMGIVMSGWASNNKWSTMGAARSAAQIVSYEIPVGMSLLPIVLMTGSLSFQSFVRVQGAYPWQWAMFANPGTFLCVFCYFIAAMAEINRTPFDIPEAESELVSGYNTEYSGMRFGMFFVAEFANVWVISMITAIAFLGGWNFPGMHALGARLFAGYSGSFATPTFVEALDLHMAGGFVLFNALGCLTVMLKAIAGMVLIVLLRWTVPRVRIDQLMNLCWKYLVPMTIFATVVTGAWMAFLDTGWWNYTPGDSWTSWNKCFAPLMLILIAIFVRAFLQSRAEWAPARRSPKSTSGTEHPTASPEAARAA